MEWGRQQAEALGRVDAWLTGKSSQVFRLGGFAGTGKTTLAKHIAESAGGRVLFVAPTGKAADVLRRKGCAGAATIHSKIYRMAKGDPARLKELVDEKNELVLKVGPKGTEEQMQRLMKLDQLITAEKKSLSRPRFRLNLESGVSGATLVVCDEGSMVQEEIGKDLLSFGAPVLVLGDPFQLPPVGSARSLLGENQFDYVLTDVHRQALDSPVIRLSMRVREGSGAQLGKVGNDEDGVLVESQRRFGPEEILAAGQLLVGKNATRVSFNRRYRQLLGRSQYPERNDRLICLRNNRESGLFNGQGWLVETAGPELDGVRQLSLRPEEDPSLPAVEVDVAEEAFWSERPPQFVEDGVDVFTYGYAITVHKSQGSEYDRVLVWSDWGNKDYDRWLYTAVTRARRRVHLLV